MRRSATAATLVMAENEAMTAPRSGSAIGGSRTVFTLLTSRLRPGMTAVSMFGHFWYKIAERNSKKRREKTVRAFVTRTGNTMKLGAKPNPT